MEKPETVGQTYCLGGAEAFTWPELHRAAAQAITGRGRWVLPLPAWYGKLLARVFPGSLLPFNRDQVIMSQEDNTCDLAPFTAAFGWTPRGFRETLAGYAGRM